MSDEKVLTKEIAEQFLAEEDSVNTDRFTAIDDAAAESLSKHKGSLDLGGLTELSDAAAESLSKFQGCLWLCGLTNMSDAVADHLVWRLVGDGDSLHLPSLRTLRELRQQGCDIAPKAITLAKTLEARAGKEEAWDYCKEELESLSDYIDTDDGRHISDVIEAYELACKVAANEGLLTREIVLEISSLHCSLFNSALATCTHLDEDAASSLSELDEDLRFPNVTFLSDAAAEALCEYEEGLAFNLGSLPESAVAILRDHWNLTDIR